MNRALKPASPRWLLRILPVFAFFIFCPAGVARAQTLEAAARQLARKIAATLLPQEGVALDVRNLSSLSPAEAAAARRALEAELRAHGLRLAEPRARHVEIRVTLSENLETYLWAAEFPRGETPTVVMVAWPRPASGGQHSSLPVLLIQRQFLREQAEPILDVAFLYSSNAEPQRMVLLEPSRVAIYKSKDGEWQLDQSYVLTRSKLVPRDPVGRLAVSGEAIGATLQGDSCQVFLQPAARVACQGVRLDWPPRYIGIVDDGGKKTPPWHAHASLTQNGQQLAIIAGVDGLARLYEDGPDSVATFKGWGSDLAALQSRCGGGAQLLVTRPGDWSEPDAVQAFELRDREAVAVSPPIDFPGPVTALWSARDSTSAIAVARNLKTGFYEAYRLWISCGN